MKAKSSHPEAGASKSRTEIPDFSRLNNDTVTRRRERIQRIQAIQAKYAALIIVDGLLSCDIQGEALAVIAGADPLMQAAQRSLDEFFQRLAWMRA